MSKEKQPTPPGSENGSTPADCTTTSCPLANCPTDFQINAPCKIIKANGGNVQMTAADLPGFSGGTFAWSTTSTKVSLINPNSSTVTVQGSATPSAGRDAETITVTRSASGCSPVVKTVNVTVAKVTFSAATTTQRYGYDNFDTPADPLDDHISIKKLDYTFLKVDIEGGALGTDFDFVCDDASVCTIVAPGATASFDLRLDAGAKNKADTTLHAKVKCPSATSFANIQVHVYKEKKVEVVVAKIYDSQEAGTNLRFPNADYAAETNNINNKMKEAVVKLDISNYDTTNAKTDVRYDLDGNGALSYDIDSGGGTELDAIKTAMTGTGTKTRVAIVRKMKSYYYLSAAAAVGDTTVTIKGGRVFYVAGDTFPIGTGASKENVTFASSSGSTITLSSPLTKAHAAGDHLEFPASGWSSDPILVIEGNSSFNILKRTIPHEAGHRNLGLTDVDDTTNIMHYSRARTDYRLRYCPRTKYRGGGTENQWETISRR